MSELDLGSTPTQPTVAAAAAPRRLRPRAPDWSSPRRHPSRWSQPEQAAGAIPVDPAKQTELDTRRRRRSPAELAALDPRSPGVHQEGRLHHVHG